MTRTRTTTRTLTTMIDTKLYSWEKQGLITEIGPLRPIRDSISVETWRTSTPDHDHFRRRYHQYPLRGCHGGPLELPDAEDRTDIP